MQTSEDEQFESTDAGASHTFPQQAGTIRKGGFVMIKQRPCKVLDVLSSKPGKHGHAKCKFVGADIFTGKKLEDVVPAGHNCNVPRVVRTDYQLLDISRDGFLSLLTEAGDTRDDLPLPSHDEELVIKLKDGLNCSKELVVTVMAAVGEEQISAVKEM